MRATEAASAAAESIGIDDGFGRRQFDAHAVRAWLEAGTDDDGAGSAASSHRNFKLANERMATALQGRGYHVHFDEAAGAGHVDQGPLRQTLPAALIWLWRGFKP